MVPFVLIMCHMAAHNGRSAFTWSHTIQFLNYTWATEYLITLYMDPEGQWVLPHSILFSIFIFHQHLSFSP